MSPVPHKHDLVVENERSQSLSIGFKKKFTPEEVDEIMTARGRMRQRILGTEETGMNMGD